MSRRFWDLVDNARAAATPGAPYAVDEHGRRLTFGELRDHAESMAAAFYARGIGPGAVVAWQLHTSLETMLASCALARLDVVQIPLLTIYRSRETRHILESCAVDHWLVPEDAAGDLGAVIGELRDALPAVHVLEIGRDEPGGGDAATLPPVPADAADDAVRWIFHTSGTTAEPKGAKHTDRTVIAACDAYVAGLGITDEDVAPIVFPYAHVGGIVVLGGALMTGARNIVVERWDPDTTIPLLAREGITLPGVAQVFHLAYLDAQRRQPDEVLFPCARAYTSGGAAKNADLHYRLRAEMGAPLLSNYGSTECPMMTGWPAVVPDEVHALTEGTANPGVEFEIVGPDSRPVPTGVAGEIHVRGPQLFVGYVDTSLDQDAFDHHGCFKTGDLGVLGDDGYLRIVGRVKDIIIRKGENISAVEVEDLLFSHPLVREVAVIGVPDEVVGERCCAVVVAARADTPVDPAELAGYLRGQGLMIQKIPERWEFVDALPRNGPGKVLKAELRARFAGPDAAAAMA